MAVNYSTLVAAQTTVGSIAYWINYGRIDSAGILTEAEAWIYDQLRVPEMRALADIAIAEDDTYVSKPTGFLDPIHLGIPGVGNITQVDVEQFRRMLPLDEDNLLPEGVPTLWADYDDRINFNTKADAAYTAKMAYYKTPTALSVSNETNWLTINHPTLLRRVCLMFAAEARKEFDSMDRAEIKALSMIEEIKRDGDLGMRSSELDFNWEEARY